MPESVCRHTTHLTPREAAEKAGVSRGTIYNWLRRYGIGVKVGGRFKVDPDALELLLTGGGDGG